jgi:hypothetical protein
MTETGGREGSACNAKREFDRNKATNDAVLQHQCFLKSPRRDVRLQQVNIRDSNSTSGSSRSTRYLETSDVTATTNLQSTRVSQLARAAKLLQQIPRFPFGRNCSASATSKRPPPNGLLREARISHQCGISMGQLY